MAQGIALVRIESFYSGVSCHDLSRSDAAATRCHDVINHVIYRRHTRNKYTRSRRDTRDIPPCSWDARLLDPDTSGFADIDAIEDVNDDPPKKEKGSNSGIHCIPGSRVLIAFVMRGT